MTKISGGKSEERGASNGFHVNVLGRVVNQGDPSFGEENLNHAAWARFRMTVRADELNQYLTTNREQFKERRGLKIFRAFLRRVFNKARTAYDSDTRARDAGWRRCLGQVTWRLVAKSVTQRGVGNSQDAITDSRPF